MSTNETLREEGVGAQRRLAAIMGELSEAHPLHSTLFEQGELVSRPPEALLPRNSALSVKTLDGKASASWKLGNLAYSALTFEKQDPMWGYEGVECQTTTPGGSQLTPAALAVLSSYVAGKSLKNPVAVGANLSPFSSRPCEKLLRRLLSPNPVKRPTAEELLSPAFPFVFNA